MRSPNPERKMVAHPATRSSTSISRIPTSKPGSQSISPSSADPPGDSGSYQALAFAFVLGLVAHIGGYAIRASPPGEPLGLVADLLYALGYALWTGVVVVVFVQVIPEVKKRQFQQAVAVYEAKVRDRGRPEGPQM
jgi:hypothetical protein